MPRAGSRSGFDARSIGAPACGQGDGMRRAGDEKSLLSGKFSPRHGCIGSSGCACAGRGRSRVGEQGMGRWRGRPGRPRTEGTAWSSGISWASGAAACVAKAGNAEFRIFLPWYALTVSKHFDDHRPKATAGVLRVLLREADRCWHFPVSPQRRDVGARKPGLFPGLPTDAGGAERFEAR